MNKTNQYIRLWVLYGVLTLLIMGLPISAQLIYRQAIHDPLRRQKSRVLEEKPEPVYDVYGEYVIRGTKVHNTSLRAMLDTGIKKLAGTEDARAAWRCFIHDEDVVALKFSRVGGRELSTNYDFAAALLQNLYDAGFKPQNFMLVGLDEPPPQAKDTRPCPYGWQKEKVDFGSDSDYLVSWLNEVTAIINIPLFMDDNIIGLRGTMANLTWPMIKQPARFYRYDTQGDPFIPEIYNLPQIRGKVRLHIANALRILYYGGPLVNQRYVYEHGAAIFSLDPVALDTVALKLICRARREMPLPQGAPETITAPYLKTAQMLGLGYADLNSIEYDQIKHEKWVSAANPSPQANAAP